MWHIDAFPLKTTERIGSVSVIARASSTNCRICWWTFVVMTTALPERRPYASAGASAASVLPVPQAPSKSTSRPPSMAAWIWSIAAAWDS